MNNRAPMQRFTAMVLSVIMVMGMSPVSALAETGAFPIGASGEVTAFEALESDIAVQNVPIGTSQADLELPNTLTATVRLAASGEEPVLDSGDADSDSGSADTVSGSAIGIDNMEDSESGEEAEIASPSDAEETGDNMEAEPVEKPVGSTGILTAPMPVTWTSSPEYDGEAAGTYIFTPELPEGLTLASVVEVPAITVTVGAVTIIGTVTAFEELPENVRWQNTSAPEFPETVSGMVEGETVQIPVTWDTEQDYDPQNPQRGLYVFTAVLGEGYGVADSVELPRMTIYIPQTVGRMMARMAGGGTTDSPLEITTAAQLAEIATLVNARQNGLELFLFNDAGAKVSLKLMNDIDLSAYTKGEGWVPIGTETTQFKGSFDGAGKTITNLTIDRTDSEDQGLFGVIGTGGTVKNLGVVSTEVEGGDYVGGVAGTVYGGGSVQYCYSTGAVSGTGSVGGVAGYVKGSVENCYSTGAVSGIGSVGGVVGSAVGGSTIENCYSTSVVTGTDDFVSGVAGTVYGIVKNCAALNPSVSGTGGLGRVAGYVDGGTLSGNLAFYGMTVTEDGSAKSLVEGADQVDGASKNAVDIKVAGFFESLFGNDMAWTYEEGNLPGFGAAVDMPVHITGASDPNFRGAGTSEDPYQIATATQLAKLAELVTAGNPSYHSAHYKLMNDLDLSTYGVTVDSNGWSPIGRSSNPFGGSFDGNGKTVSGLSFNNEWRSSIGLFGFVSGTVENLSVVDVELRSSGYMGGIAGYVTGTVKNCSSSGSIIGTRFNGGIVGGLTGTVENCYSTAVVSGSDENGGVAGYVNGGRIINCAALGPSVGGAPNSGRVSGFTSSATLSGNIAFGGMTVNGSIVSGGTSTGKQGTPKTAAEINAEGFFEALFGNDPAWTYEKSKLPGFGTAVSMPTHLIAIDASPFEGEGTSEGDPYLIKTASDLAKLAELVNAGTSPYADDGKYYRLENDIDLSAYTSGEGWMPIGYASKSFEGIFDGNNKSITGLTINRPTADKIGLFGYISSKVHNIRIIGANVIGKDRVGGVAGYAWGATVENCSVTGSISGVEGIGGVLGRASSGTLQNCYSSGSVTGSGNYVGGIIGYLEYAATTVKRCYSDSRVSGNYYVGGVTGEVGAGSVENCYSTGNVTGGRYVGGVAGSVSSGSVQNCYSTGSVLGTDSEGYVGGVLGTPSSGTVKNCVALNPSINAGAYNFGRVVGKTTSGTLLNNYAFSRIPGTWANKGLNAKDGADVTSQTLFGGNLWTTADNWDTAAWDSDIWTFASGKLPTLSGLAGQSGDGGLYLTARNIQYAAVGTGSFTYNGSEQIPTVTFDGETLIKNTDYIVSITSTDGSGTSAGTNAGEVTLTLTGAGSFYGTKNISYTIDPQPVTITPSAGQKKKYGEPNTELTFANDGGLAPEAFTGKLSRGGGENVGTYAITLGTLSAGGNYAISLATGMVNFTIEQAKVASISTIMTNVSRTAYQMRTAATAQAVVDSAGLPSNVSVITDGGTAMLPITWSTVSAYNIKGTEYAVTGTLTGNENIDANSITKSITVTVTPVTAVNPTFSDTLVVTNSDSSATAAELGSDILPVSGSIAVEGESIAYTINWNGGQTLDRTAVGTEQTFTGVINYSSPPAWLTLPSDLMVSSEVTVTDKTLVTIGGITTANKTYDGTSHTPNGTVTCSHSFPANQLAWLYESTDSAGYRNSTAPTNAGAYKLTISVPESNANYAGSAVFTFVIEKRQITLAADHKSVIKGSDVPELTYTIGNLPTDKTKADALNAEPVLACPTFDGNTPGSYAITLTGGTATDNYTITTRTNGTLTVAEQTYTVTFNLNGGSRTGGGELSQTIAESGAATAPIVTRNGYTFTGWDKAFTNVASNLAVTAGWSYNGGGGDGGGSSTVPSAPSAPEKKPDQPVTATAPIAAVGQNGAASASIPDKTVTDAIAKAQADAKAQGKTANGISVALNVTMPKGTTSLAATLIRNSLNSLVSAGVTELEISGAPVSLSLDLNALKEIQKQSSGDISISFTPVTGLSKAAKALLGNRPVYSITIGYTDKHGKTQNISSLGNGTATLSIPYTPGKNEAVGYLFGVYVDGAGNATRIPGSAYDPNSRSLLLGTNHFSVYGVGYEAPSAKFTDISTHWGKESIDYVVGRGLLSGTSKTTFAPDTAMTREMLVTALGRLTGVDLKAYTTNSFTDVKAGSTFRPYIEWAYKIGIVQGIGNQQFAPDRAITREEIAVIFANYAKATGYKLPVTREAVTYEDASSIGSVYKTAVTAMQQAGIMIGGTGNKFNPKASATRAEVSAMLHRYIKLTIDPATAQGWAKNDAGQYLYYKDGKVVTGTQTIDGMKYFFEINGTLKTGWVQDGGNWCFYSGNIRLTGWWNIGSDVAKKTYYFDTNGNMVSGKWLQIDGKWYYLNADGSLAVSTKIDGYEVDENGVRKVK